MKNSSDKWLNLEHYFQLLRQDDDIQKIYYFTAKVKGQAQARQETYFKALQTLNLVQIVFGLYKSRQRKCKVASCSNPQKSYAEFDEKRTDVNIALQMLDDAYKNKTLPIALFKKTQFPQSLVDNSGQTINKPSSW